MIYCLNTKTNSKCFKLFVYKDTTDKPSFQCVYS